MYSFLRFRPRDESPIIRLARSLFLHDSIFDGKRFHEGPNFCGIFHREKDIRSLRRDAFRQPRPNLQLLQEFSFVSLRQKAAFQPGHFRTATSEETHRIRHQYFL